MTPGTFFTAAILAGGQARRLGGVDKSALSVGTQSILGRQLALLRGLTPHILVVANDAAPFRKTGVPVIPDRIKGVGALGGLYTALAEAPTEQVLVIACDMPFLTAPFLTRLVTLGTGVDAAIPRDAAGLHPFCATYARRVKRHLKSRIDAGETTVAGAIAGLVVRDVGPGELSPFDADGWLLTNVKTPDDYARVRGCAEAAAAADR